MQSAKQKIVANESERSSDAPSASSPRHGNDIGFVEEGAALEALTGAGTDASTAKRTAPRRPPASSRASQSREHFDVVVIGAGQAGLSVGYYLAQRGLKFVILDGNQRIGDTWRKRWDSLRLFTPARYDGLDGMPFPAPPHSFPTKDEMADYLESYAARFELPVRTGVRVERLWKEGGRYRIQASGGHYEADQVVVAMANYQRPKVPAFSAELASDIVQLHSADYKNPGQLAAGPVLIAGAGNSGSEIAMELSRQHRIYMSGRHTGQLPFRIAGFWGRFLFVRLVLRVLFHRILTINTRLGLKARPKIVRQGGPLIRVRSEELAAAGVQRRPKVAGVKDGLPLLADGSVLKVANVVWCTGFTPSFSWIDLPIFDEDGEPLHTGGVVDAAPGLYFVGLHFLYSLSSTMIHGVGRDAARIVTSVAGRAALSTDTDARVGNAA